MLTINSIVDWDNVQAVPLRISANSLSDLLFPIDKPQLQLDPGQDSIFCSELMRLVKSDSNSSFTSQWAEMFSESTLNLFLFLVLRSRMRSTSLRSNYPALLVEALKRTPEILGSAAETWRECADECHLRFELPFPEEEDYNLVREMVHSSFI